MTLSSEALLTLSNGKRYVFTPETSDEFRYEREYPHSRPVIKIHIRQHGVQKPFHSSMVTVETHTDHWMVPVGDAQDVTKFTQINQQRLTSALWELHGRLNPQPFSIERWEDSDGHFRGMVGPNETPAILEKHRVEWVTRNFEWTQPDESTFEFEYVGDQPFDLVNGPHMFPKYYLELTLPDVEYDKLETVVVDLPDSRWKADLIGSSADWIEQS